MSQPNQLSFFDDPENKAFLEAEPELILDEDKISLLALSEIQGVGFATIRALFEAYHGKLTQVWDADDDNLFNHLHRASIPQPKQIIYQIKARAKEVLEAAKVRFIFLKRHKIEIIFRGTALYPKGLYNLKSPPSWLFVEGNVEILHSSSIVAVVGTREPSENGLNTAKRLSVLLVTQGYIILSGLAEGIDEAGHQTAVDYGAPTIAVLGHGIDVTFPVGTSYLRHQIVERGGAVVSEYLPKDMYNRERFVQRNRIQAALANAVAVVEGRAKSGTAHTVRFARELNRPLFGVRIGPPLEIPQQELLNELIKYQYPAFDLNSQDGCNQLTKYLETRIPQVQLKRVEPPHLFSGVIEEIQRLLSHYDAKQSDFDWLLSQIRLYRDNVERTRENDNQSGHP